MFEQTLRINYKLPGMNEIIKAAHLRKGKYSQYAEMKKRLGKEIGLLIISQQLKPIVRAELDFHWYEKKRNRDPDNIVAGRKFILDALVDRGIIGDDRSKYIVGWNDNFHFGEKDGVGVVIKEYERMKTL